MNIQTALLNTVLGMGTVFIVLVFISFIIWLLGVIVQAATAPKKTVPVNKTTVAPAPVKETAPVVSNDNELVAVIAAAIAASISETTGQVVMADGLVIRSIKKRR